MTASIASDELKKAVVGILKDADLTTLSSKKVRKQLEEKYGQDLTDRKKEIDEMVMDFIENGNHADKSDSDSERENGTNQQDASDDDEESDFEPPEDGEPVAKKKRMSKKSDSDSDEVDDEKLAQKLQDEEDDGRRKTRGRQTSRRPPAKKKAAKSKSSGDGEGKPKKKGLYGQECILSASLAEVMGKDTMARSDVVKKMWEIIKERNLTDPKQRQFMICDEQLQKVFGRKRVKTFGMMKYLKDHMFKPEEYNDLVIK